MAQETGFLYDNGMITERKDAPAPSWDDITDKPEGTAGQLFIATEQTPEGVWGDYRPLWSEIVNIPLFIPTIAFTIDATTTSQSILEMLAYFRTENSGMVILNAGAKGTFFVPTELAEETHEGYKEAFGFVVVRAATDLPVGIRHAVLNLDNENAYVYNEQ